MEPEKEYKITSHPKCSALCLVTCKHCVVDTTGKFTGRTFQDKHQNNLYEFIYLKENKVCSGVFLDEEISTIK